MWELSGQRLREITDNVSWTVQVEWFFVKQCDTMYLSISEQKFEGLEQKFEGLG